MYIFYNKIVADVLLYDKMIIILFNIIVGRYIFTIFFTQIYILSDFKQNIFFEFYFKIR